MTGTRRLAQAAMTAGAYVVLTWAFGPISYGAMQFRLAEVLKPLALWGEQYIWGLSIGLFIANLASPTVGIWELLWMPAVCYLGGRAAYALRRTRYVALMVYAIGIGMAVAGTLRFTLRLPVAATAWPIIGAEATLMFAGDRIIAGVLHSRTRVRG